MCRFDTNDAQLIFSLRDLLRESLTIIDPPPLVSKKLKRHPSARAEIKISNEDAEIRKELEQQWIQQQLKMQSETVTLEYLYWDGAGYRNHVQIKKGDTLSSFLVKARKHHERIKNIPSDNLYFVKDDLILFNVRLGRASRIM